MNLRELHQKATSVMLGFFTDHRSVPPMFFAVDGRNNLHIMPAPDYPQKREFYSMVLRAYFAANGVTAYAFAAEAWVAIMHLKKGERPPVERTPTGGLNLAPGVAPAREQPGSKECVMAVAVDKTETIQTVHEIVRRPGKPPTLGASPFDDFDDDDKGPPFAERAGATGLLDTHIDAAFMESVRRLLALIPMPKYFPGFRVMTPAEHDGMHN